MSVITLYFKSEISSQPFDFRRNRRVTISNNAVIGTLLDVRCIKGFNDLRAAIDSFDYFVIEGKLGENDRSPKQLNDIYWLQKNDAYQLAFGVVARFKGDYVFTIPDAIGKIKENKNCEGGINISLSNNNSKNNAYLLKPYYSLPNIPSDDSAHVFCIRIK